jgi:hypothetical protein
MDVAVHFEKVAAAFSKYEHKQGKNHKGLHSSL